MAHQKQPAKSNNVRDRVASNGDLIAAEHYEGPLPHPQILAQYDAIVPGAAKEIIDEFKKSAEVIRVSKAKELEAVIQRDKRGQWMAFALAGSVLVVAAYALHLGHAVVAGGAFFTAIAGVVISFLNHK